MSYNRPVNNTCDYKQTLASDKFAKFMQSLQESNTITKEIYNKALAEWVGNNIFGLEQIERIKQLNSKGVREAELLVDNLFTYKWIGNTNTRKQECVYYYKNKTDEFEISYKCEFPIEDIYHAVHKELQRLNLSFDAQVYNGKSFSTNLPDKSKLCYSIKLKW